MFRFEQLEIWQMAIDTADKLFDIADRLVEKRLYPFTEQLRGAGHRIFNNIAEGSGSNSNKDFSNFLKFSRPSVFECANILFVLKKRDLVEPGQLFQRLTELEHLSKKISNFQKSLSKFYHKRPTQTLDLNRSTLGSGP
jgi:four helix bundle protein